jgi:hypothetical protein
VTLELVGREVAKEFHAISAFAERETFGHEAFQFDRADLRAVLFLLAALLRVLVAVEIALHAVGSAVEEIDGRPQQVLEVGLEAGVTQRRDERVEDVGHGAPDGGGFRQRPGVGLVLERTMAIELELGEDVVGRR